MRNITFRDLFNVELKEIYNADYQSIELFAKLEELATSQALKETLVSYIESINTHLKRLETIVIEVNNPIEKGISETLNGIIRESSILLQNREKSPVLDAAIICLAQKVFHYKIATYGALRSFSMYLDFDSSIVEMLQHCLYDEGAADRQLTKIAEGSFFSNGVNAEAAEESELLQH